MRIFITGGTGFIGKPTVKLLRKKSHKLLLLSRKGGKGLLKGDLSSVNKWIDKVKRFKPDVVLNLAWQDIPKYDALTTARNVSNTLNLFHHLVNINCPKVVTVSSCVEYEGKKGKVKENLLYTLPNVKEDHGLLREGKIFLGRFAERLTNESNTKFIRAVPFFVYGPGQRAKSLLPSVIKDIISGKVPEIRNPKAIHDFVYVGDVAEALKRLAEKKVLAGRYNVGSGKLTTVSEMVNAALAACKRKNLYKIAKKPKGLYADISKIKKATGWKPKTSIKEGIKKMVNS